jgi:putative endonuclease
LGQSGEDLAAAFLETHGYEILDRNVQHGTREIDIVAYDRGLAELVFVEVKTRDKGFFGNPSEAVNKDKLRSMQYVAGVYRWMHKRKDNYRFDIITVVSGTIYHYENVTWGRRR